MSQYIRSSLVAATRRLLETDLKFLEDAVLAIDARQTEDELRDRQTRHDNGRGWQYQDAAPGGKMAARLRAGKRLLYPAGAARMMRKYAGQLLRVSAATSALAEAA